VSVNPDVDCPACGAKVKIGNGHSKRCPSCGGKIIRYKKKKKNDKLKYHPPGNKLLRI